MLFAGKNVDLKGINLSFSLSCFFFLVWSFDYFFFCTLDSDVLCVVQGTCTSLNVFSLTLCVCVCVNLMLTSCAWCEIIRVCMFVSYVLHGKAFLYAYSSCHRCTLSLCVFSFGRFYVYGSCARCVCMRPGFTLPPPVSQVYMVISGMQKVAGQECKPDYVCAPRMTHTQTHIKTWVRGKQKGKEHCVVQSNSHAHYLAVT